MKKNIEFVTLNRNLAKIVSDYVSSLALEGAHEFGHALTELSDGTSETLLLTVGQAQQLAPDTSIHCRDITIDLSTRRVTRGGEDISLTPKEFDILCLLARNRGQVFSKEQIYREVWEENFIMDNSNVMSFIRKLRKKLEPDADQPQYILTVWGLGYKFNEKD